MSVGTSLPMSTQPVGMSMSQQPFQTMTNMTMRPPGPQQAVNPNFPSGMAVSSGASSVSVVSNVGPGGTVVTTDARQSLPPPMRDRKIVWTGKGRYMCVSKYFIVVLFSGSMYNLIVTQFLGSSLYLFNVNDALKINLMC